MTDVEDEIRRLRQEADYWEKEAGKIAGLGQRQLSTSRRLEAKVRFLRGRIRWLEKEATRDGA